MLDAASVRAVDAARLAPRVVRPLHDGYTFAALPGTVERLLVGETDRAALPAAALVGLPARPERVVLVLLDAFGWRFLQRHADHHPLLRRLVAEGTVAKLTTQFPSTTTAHVTTLHSGRPVGAHGLYEWNLYEPALDVLITPMLFAYAGDNRRDTLWTADVTPRDLYPVSTLYRALADRGVAAHALQPAAFTPSTYDGVVLDGARIHAYERLDEGLAGLAAVLRGERRPAYAYVYVDAVDQAGHRCGPSSAEFDQVAGEALDAIEAALPGFPPGTLLLLCADHGQVDVDPERTIFLNQRWPQIAGLLRRGRDGRPLVPAGSARDLFLHVAPGALEPVVEGLRALLGGRAEVHATADLLAAGLFGPAAGPRLTARLGDVCVLPAPGETVWWRERGRFGMAFRGHHGGLTTDEAETFVAGLALEPSPARRPHGGLTTDEAEPFVAGLAL